MALVTGEADSIQGNAGMASAMIRRLVRPIHRSALRAGLFVALGLLAGCGTGPVAPDLPISQSEYRLGHGDRIQITVYDQANLSGEHMIDGSGNVSMPLIGTVPASDATAMELEARIVDKLKPQYLNDPRVSVQVLDYRPFYIVGEVKTPGSYPYVDGMVVMHAVALAGGFTYRARENEFYITRSIDPEHQMRLTGPNSPVLPGDLIVVRERYF